MYLTNTPADNRLHPTERHLAKRLREDHGYRTALFGVQHECAHEHVHNVLRPHVQFVTDPWPAASKSAQAFERWLPDAAAGDRPFYAQIGLHEAHLGAFYSGNPPAIYPAATDDERGLARPAWLVDDGRSRETIATLQGLLRRGDELVSRVRAALERAGIARETLVCVCVDHGVGLPRAKGTCYDAGTEVGWLLHWPGMLPEGHVVDALCGQVDVLPTLLELMKLPPATEAHGRSFADHARGDTCDERHDAVFSHMTEAARSIRTRRHKLIRNFRPPGVGAGQLRGMTLADGFVVGPTHLELYDLDVDPDERHNLADDPAHATVRDDLDARLWRYLAEHDDFVLHEPVRDAWQAATREPRPALTSPGAPPSG